MRDDPHRIAEWLIQERGLEQARTEVLSGVLQAQKAGDNYALSVWREVKRQYGKFGGEKTCPAIFC